VSTKFIDVFSKDSTMSFSTPHSTEPSSLPSGENDEDIKAMQEFESSLYFSFLSLVCFVLSLVLFTLI